MRYFVVFDETNGNQVAIPVDLITAVTSTKNGHCVIHWDKYSAELSDDINTVVSSIHIRQQGN